MKHHVRLVAALITKGFSGTLTVLDDAIKNQPHAD
ncbi:hypothetical protein B23_3615 [Geobacillus thermoleovorans B23]|nr:hypothetical protein B23_3615 [Geobacillus thermoleovorans B23]